MYQAAKSVLFEADTPLVSTFVAKARPAHFFRQVVLLLVFRWGFRAGRIPGFPPLVSRLHERFWIDICQLLTQRFFQQNKSNVTPNVPLEPFACAIQSQRLAKLSADHSSTPHQLVWRHLRSCKPKTTFSGKSIAAYAERLSGESKITPATPTESLRVHPHIGASIFVLTGNVQTLRR